MGDMGWFKEINFTGEQQTWGFRWDLMGFSTEMKWNLKRNLVS
jgi:hypothetical protein